MEDRMFEQLNVLGQLIDNGKFEKAYVEAKEFLARVKSLSSNYSGYYTMLFNISGILIDIGSMQPNIDANNEGLEILESNEKEILDVIEADLFYYNLSNAKTNLLPERNPFKQSFETIEKLVELKTYLWKSLKLSNQRVGTYSPETMVNLGNALKQQFRVSEALHCYDTVNELNLDIPQAWINRSESLMLLNTISSSYSIQMLIQVKKGYENILQSPQIPPQWLPHYQELIETHSEKINKICSDENIKPDPDDEVKTQEEYDKFSNYRKFCLSNNLTLSEHSLYCKCIGSDRDNLTIPTTSGVVGDFIIPMEMILNRLKSEFSFSRRLYFEYLSHETPDELQHESCFSELLNDEILGLDVEKLRTAFRLCFGILDKIGVGICELFDLYPANGQVYFQSFWQLDRDGRRDKFEKIKTPGLLALYSIATDLNDRKFGELAFYKDWRNSLEHNFVVVHKHDVPSDLYNSYSFIDDITFIKEADFIEHLEQLLQLTRSAIFSFVFMVREKGLTSKQDGFHYFNNKIYKQGCVT